MSEPFLALLPRLLQLIENADEPLSLAELSARSGYSAWHLHRQFRFYCGMPLQSYQRLLKLQRAATAGLPANPGHRTGAGRRLSAR